MRNEGKTESPDIKLQVLIVAYGKKGIESVATLSHPEVAGVEYIVSWQYADDEPVIPESLLRRKDFRVLPTPTRGVARNRNLALDAASAPIVLESDDDVSYTIGQLRSVIKAFAERPECDFLSFKYHSSLHPRPYPETESDLSHPPKGYFIGGIEMAFRLGSVRKNNIRFNELFGIGSIFPSAEEDIFLHDVIKAGLKARFVPIEICTHESTSTYMRMAFTPEFITTKGAVHEIINPRTWPLRMIVHSLRETRKYDLPAKFNYCLNWVKGARKLRRLRRKR